MILPCYTLLREGQTNCDVKESVYNVATAKILVELELKPEDLSKVEFEKKNFLMC